MSGITKGERTELRSVVRQQFKVLRAEIEQREAELRAQIDAEIAQQFVTEDKAWADAAHLAHEAVLEANRRVNDAYRDLAGNDAHTEAIYVRAAIPQRDRKRQQELKRQAALRLTERVAAASLRLDRQEADLLRTLSAGALESDEARAFLGSIPTVGELVPAARLVEIEGAA